MRLWIYQTDKNDEERMLSQGRLSNHTFGYTDFTTGTSQKKTEPWLLLFTKVMMFPTLHDRIGKKNKRDWSIAEGLNLRCNFTI